MYTDNYDENEERNEVSYKEPSNSKNYLRIIIIVILLLVLLGLLYFAFKGKIGGSKGDDKYVLNIYPENIIVPLGKSQNISYEIRKNGIIVPEAAVRLTVVDETIASIDNTLITGLKYGKTMIMATYINPDGKSFQESKDIIVADGDPNIPVTNVNFPDGDLQMPFNGTYNINLGITPPNGYIENKVITSSNPNVVIVDNSGQVTAVSEGEAIITIDINNGAYKKDIMVYVSRDSEISKIVVSPTNITINDPFDTMKVGETVNLKYTVTPSNANTETIKWISSNEKVLTIDYRGKVKAIKEGTATIKVQTANNLSDSFTVKVEPKTKDIIDITLPVNELYLTVGESQMLVPVISPYDADNKTLLYTIDNQMVASIMPSADTSSLTITPISAGTAIITVATSDGKISKTLNITVTDGVLEPDGGGGGGGSSCASCSKVSCDAGQYCNCGKCVGCPAGNYCYNNKKTACAAGKGSIANSSSYQDCSACAKGYYSTGDGKGCIACPAGKTTSKTGATSKNDCNVDETGGKCKSGEYYDGTKCASCPSGYTNNGGATAISQCQKTVPAGQYIKTAGAAKTTACAVGTYSTVKIVNYGNTTSCTACAKGYYQDKTGQGSCTKCPDGTTTSGTGSKNASACNVTVATPKPTATTSGSCKTVQYKSGGVCKNCEAGYRCNGSTRTKCSYGYISKASSTRCDKCSSGKSNTARTACIS